MGQQLPTTFGRIPGTTFSEATWQPGRSDARHSSSTRPRLTASQWGWSRSPLTAPPSRTTSTDWLLSGTSGQVELLTTPTKLFRGTTGTPSRSDSARALTGLTQEGLISRSLTTVQLERTPHTPRFVLES